MLSAAGEDLEDPTRPDKLLKRLYSFTEAVSNASCNTSILALIRKLQDGLAAAENLPVVASQLSVPSSALRFSSAGSIPGKTSSHFVLLQSVYVALQKCLSGAALHTIACCHLAILDDGCLHGHH